MRSGAKRQHASRASPGMDGVGDHGDAVHPDVASRVGLLRGMAQVSVPARMAGSRITRSANAPSSRIALPGDPEVVGNLARHPVNSIFEREGSGRYVVRQIVGMAVVEQGVGYARPAPHRGAR